MTIVELQSTLESWGIPNQLYSIMTGGFPNETLCLIKHNAKEWEIYYSERGKKSGVKIFNSESEACEYFLLKMGRYKQA